MKCTLRLKNGKVLEANSRVGIRRQVDKLMQQDLKKLNIAPLEYQSMKSMVTDIVVDLFRKHVDEEPNMSENEQRKLFTKLFYGKGTPQTSLLARDNRLDKDGNMTKKQPDPTDVIGIMFQNYKKYSKDLKGDAQRLKFVMGLLRFTEQFEDKNIFGNPFIQDIIEDLDARGIRIQASDAPSNDPNELEGWQIEVLEIDQYENIGAFLKARFNDVRVKRFDENDRLVDVPGYLNVPKRYRTNYVYKYLSEKLGGSGSAQIMEQRIQRYLEDRDPIFTQLFSERSTNNADEQFITQVWTKIGSNAKYDFKDVVIGEGEHTVYQSFTDTRSKKDSEIIYLRLLDAFRVSTFVKNGKLDKEAYNNLVEELLDAMEEEDANLVAKLLESAGLFDATLPYSTREEAFMKAADILIRDMDNTDTDSFGIEAQLSRINTNLMAMAEFMSTVSASSINTVHLNANNDKVHEFNVANESIRTISKLREGDKMDEYNEDPFYEGNKVLEALASRDPKKQAKYVVIDGIKLPNKKKKTEYSEANKEELTLLQLFSFVKGNTIELPVHADSGSMSAITYPDHLIRLGRDPSLMADLIDLAMKEIDRKYRSFDIRYDNKTLIIFPELQDVFDQGIVTRELVESMMPDIMEARLESYKQYLDGIGLIEVREGLAPKFSPVMANMSEVILRNFVYNYSYLYPSAATILNGDPAFFGMDNMDKILSGFEKRAKQIWSPFTPLRVGAKYTSKDGTTITVRPQYNVQIFKDVKRADEKFIKRLKFLEGKYPKRYAGLLKAFEESSATDAQSYIDLFRHKEVMVGLGEWTDEYEATYRSTLAGGINKINNTRNKREGEVQMKSLGPIKPFTFDMRLDDNGNMSPRQKKDSEVVLLPMYGLEYINGKENILYNPFYKFMMEQMGYSFTENSFSVDEDFETKRSDPNSTYTDTFTSSEAIKVGAKHVQDIDSIDFDNADGTIVEEFVNTLIEDSDTMTKTEDESKYVKKDNKNAEYTRVTSEITVDPAPEETGYLPSASAIGNKVDQLVRDFFNDDVKPLETYELSDNKATITDFLNKLQELKELFDSRGETVLKSENEIVLFNDMMGIAGTVDLITYDKDGNFRIYDMKTMRAPNKSDVKDGKFVRRYRNGKSPLYDSYDGVKVSNFEKYTRQLNMYSFLLNNTHGVKTVSLGIIPIAVNYEAGDLKTSRLELLDIIDVEQRDTITVDSNIEFERENREMTFTKSRTPNGMILRFNNENYGKQQSNPEHVLDYKQDMATQVRKNIIANVDDGGIYTLPTGAKITGRELKEQFNHEMIEIMKMDFEEVTGEMTEFEDIIKMLKTEITKRGLSSNYKEALEVINEVEKQTLVKIYHPAYIYKLKQILNSIYTKGVTKQSMKSGVALANASSHGFKNPPEIKWSEDGERIEYMEAYVPIFDKELYKFIGKDGVLDVEALEKKHPHLKDMFRGVLWRVPNEAKYSTFNIKIKAFIPTESTSSVYLPLEVTTIAGLDFDIDKMYGFFYALGKRDYTSPLVMNNVLKYIGKERFNEIISDNPLWKIAADRGQYESIFSGLWLKHKNTKEYSEIIDSIRYESRQVYIPRDDSREGRQNRILDLMRGVMENEKTTFEFLTPASDFDVTAGKYMKQLGLSVSSHGFAEPHRSNEVRTNMIMGKKLTGAFAVANSGAAVFQQGNLTLPLVPTKKKDKDGNPIMRQHGYKFNGRTHSEYSGREILPYKAGKNDSDIVKLPYSYRSQNLSMWLAAVVDNGKFPYAGVLNINPATINVVISMLTAGVDMSTMIYFINTPVMRHYSELYNRYGANDRARDKAFKEINGLIDYTDKDPRYAVDFYVRELLREAKVKPGSIVKYISDRAGKTLQVWNSFKQYEKYSRDLTDFTRQIRLSEGGVGASDGDTINKILQFKQALSPNRPDGKPKMLEGQVELLTDKKLLHFHMNSLITAIMGLDVIRPVMHELSEHVGTIDYTKGVYFKIIEAIDALKTDDVLTGREIQRVISGINSYLISDKMNATPEFVMNFVQTFKDKKKEHGENYKDLFDRFFIQETTEDVFDDDIMLEFVFYLGVNSDNRDDMKYIERLMQSLYYEDPEFVKDLARYAYAIDGLTVSPHGFTHLIPNEVIVELDALDENLFESLEYSVEGPEVQMMIEDFTLEYLRNNAPNLYFLEDYDNRKSPEEQPKFSYDAVNEEVKVRIDRIDEDGNEVVEMAAAPIYGFKFEANVTGGIVRGRQFQFYGFSEATKTVTSHLKDHINEQKSLDKAEGNEATDIPEC